jgi:hypothetical protein
MLSFPTDGTLGNIVNKRLQSVIVCSSGTTESTDDIQWPLLRSLLLIMSPIRDNCNALCSNQKLAEV